MRVVEQTIYNFDELDKDVQEKLKERVRKSWADTYCETCLYDDVTEKAQELLQKYFKGKAELIDVCYDFSFSQGSGCMVEFKLQTRYGTVTIKHNNYCHYYHTHSFEILTDEDMADSYCERLKNKIVKMNSELCSFGENAILYEPTDDQIISELTDYGQEYYKDGGEFYDRN